MNSDENLPPEENTPAKESVQDRRNLIDPETMEQFFPMTVPEAVLDLEDFINNVIHDTITFRSPDGSLYDVSISDTGTLVITKQTA